MNTEIGELISNDDLINEIKKILRSPNSIDRKYRKSAEFGGKGKHYERPFCYELFHQLRNAQDNKNSIISKMDLHCELPKGYRSLSRTPDFVIHKQNTDKQNLIVIEVKRFTDSSESKIKTTVEKEIKKFNDYHKHLKYQSYIELVFGEESVEINKIRKSISNRRGAFEKLKEGDYKINFWFYDIESGELQDDEEFI